MLLEISEAFRINKHYYYYKTTRLYTLLDQNYLINSLKNKNLRQPQNNLKAYRTFIYIITIIFISLTKCS